MKNLKPILLLTVALLCCGRGHAQEMSLSTNVLGLASLGTMNMEASWGFSRHWTANVGVRYNPFTFPGREGVADRMQARQRTLAVGGRYWPWHIHSGWWLAGKAQYQEYNFGGLTEAETSEGDRIGGGLTGGYTYMLSPRFNLEVGAGVWAGYETYTTYACPECGRITGRGDRPFVLPNEILLGLVYVF
jgi:hypothetical protein